MIHLSSAPASIIIIYLRKRKKSARIIITRHHTNHSRPQAHAFLVPEQAMRGKNVSLFSAWQSHPLLLSEVGWPTLQWRTTRWWWCLTSTAATTEEDKNYPETHALQSLHHTHTTRIVLYDRYVVNDQTISSARSVGWSSCGLVGKSLLRTATFTTTTEYTAVTTTTTATAARRALRGGRYDNTAAAAACCFCCSNNDVEEAHHLMTRRGRRRLIMPPHENDWVVGAISDSVRIVQDACLCASISVRHSIDSTQTYEEQFGSRPVNNKSIQRLVWASKIPNARDTTYDTNFSSYFPYLNDIILLCCCCILVVVPIYLWLCVVSE